MGKNDRNFEMVAQEAQRLVDRGMTVKKAAKRLKCSVSTLERYGVRAGRRGRLAADGPALTVSLPAMHATAAPAAVADDTDLPDGVTVEDGRVVVSDDAMRDAVAAAKMERAAARLECGRVVDSARHFLAAKYPYYETCLYMLRWVWDAPGVDTLAVDDEGRIFINSMWLTEHADDTGEIDFDGLSPKMAVVAGLMHEVNHLVRFHMDRCGERDRQLFNKAGDLEINTDLDNYGFLLPPNCLRVSQYNDQVEKLAEKMGSLPKEVAAAFPLTEGLNAEEFYDRLKTLKEFLQEKRDEQKGDDDDDGDEGSEGGEGGEGGEQGGGQSGGQGGGDGGEGDDIDDLLADLLGEKPGLGSGKCGRCASGGQKSSEDERQAATGDGQEVEAMSSSDIADMMRQTAHDIVEQAMKNPGSVAGGMLRSAKKLLNPVVPWENVLSKHVRDAFERAAEGLEEVTYSRPDPRVGALRPGESTVLRPGKIYHQPKVSIVIDTSGSMGDHQITAAVTEAGGIIDRALSGAEVNVLSCDYDPGAMQKITSANHIELTGGGGTDMGRGIEAVQQNAPESDVIIVLTDGYTPWPDEQPGRAKVVIGIIGGDAHDGLDEYQSLADACPSWSTPLHIPVTNK